jgi:hypothetical protein
MLRRSLAIAATGACLAVGVSLAEAGHEPIKRGAYSGKFRGDPPGTVFLRINREKRVMKFVWGGYELICDGERVVSEKATWKGEAKFNKRAEFQIKIGKRDGARFVHVVGEAHGDEAYGTIAEKRRLNAEGELDPNGSTSCGTKQKWLAKRAKR